MTHVLQTIREHYILMKNIGYVLQNETLVEE